MRFKRIPVNNTYPLHLRKNKDFAKLLLQMRNLAHFEDPALEVFAQYACKTHDAANDCDFVKKYFFIIYYN